MHRGEVAKLLMTIVDNYPNFDTSDANVDRHLKYLHDLPYEVAARNVDEHIRTSKYPPNIAEIRGSLGDQMDKQRMKDTADEYLAQLDLLKKRAVPPPPGLREELYAELRGNHGN